MSPSTLPANGSHIDNCSLYSEQQGEDVLDSMSQSSASMFGEEPYKTFQYKVALICSQHFKFREVITEHMKGGSYNRVVGVKVVPSSPRPDKSPPRKRMRLIRDSSHRGGSSQSLQDQFSFRAMLQRFQKPREYIFRVERLRQTNYGTLHDVAVLKFVRKNTKLPIAKVIGWDDSYDNVLESPYMVQERLPGTNLSSIWFDLTQDQLSSALQQVMNAQRQLHAIKSDRGGVLRPLNNRIKRTKSLIQQVDRFDVNLPRFAPEDITPTPPSKAETNYEFLLELMDRVASRYSNCITPELQQLRKIILALRSRGFLLDTDQFHLVHSDLYPRNILVETPTENSIKISGIIDWDAAYTYFAPAFFAYRPPAYFWANLLKSSSGDVRDPPEQNALLEPPTPAMKLLKDQFMREAGRDWLRYALTPEYAIARRLFSFLLLTERTVQDWEEAEDIAVAWKQLHPDDDLKVDYGFDITLSESALSDADQSSVCDDASDTDSDDASEAADIEADRDADADRDAFTPTEQTVAAPDAVPDTSSVEQSETNKGRKRPLEDDDAAFEQESDSDSSSSSDSSTEKTKKVTQPGDDTHQLFSIKHGKTSEKFHPSQLFNIISLVKQLAKSPSQCANHDKALPHPINCPCLQVSIFGLQEEGKRMLDHPMLVEA